MRRCPTCGRPTEAESDFCPACAGYAAPATVYSYAPSRLSRSDSEFGQLASPLPRTQARARDDPPATPAGGHRRRSRTRRRNEGRWIVAAATLIVLIIAAGTTLLELGHNRRVSSPRPRPAENATTPAASQAAIPPTPAPLVTVAPAAAASPHETAVLSFLTGYFTAINQHDFSAYQQLFSPAQRTDLSAAGFSAGYGTTTDSAITLTSVGVIGSGELVAQVRFVSHQQPSASPTNSACTAWIISLYLLQQGSSSYLLQQPPAGYQPSYSACS